jgi:ABC-2 type transport system permease protein/oleandomycin transport system permease protein
MTALPAAVEEPGALTQVRWAVSDTLTFAERNLLVWTRIPTFIIATLIQPVMFVLLFRYVFGGAIPVHVAGGYISFLMPGIIAQSVAFGAFATAMRLVHEKQKGLIDRLRSMPTARSAVLAGRLVADAVRICLMIVILVGVGYAVGFRFQNGFALAVGMVVLATIFAISTCCAWAFTGLAMGSAESAQAFSMICLYPLTFVSSAFVPINTMPGWLQAFAANQPVTVVINAMRALALGGPVATDLWKSAAWLGGIFIIFIPLAVRAYARS